MIRKVLQALDEGDAKIPEVLFHEKIFKLNVSDANREMAAHLVRMFLGEEIPVEVLRIDNSIYIDELVLDASVSSHEFKIPITTLEGKTAHIFLREKFISERISHKIASAFNFFGFEKNVNLNSIKVWQKHEFRMQVVRELFVMYRLKHFLKSNPYRSIDEP